jgi:hypothetical protein
MNRAAKRVQFFASSAGGWCKDIGPNKKAAEAFATAASEFFEA